MKIYVSFISLFAVATIAAGQGTFVYDQQSATGGFATYGAPINENQPTGQSFTPALSSVGFVAFQFSHAIASPDTSATIAVNLWGGSIGGSLLGSTDPVFLPAGFFGNNYFFFPTPVPVTPGTTYYFQPVIVSGGDNDWFVRGDLYNYSGGAFITHGQPSASDADLWFREGMVVPEPATVVLGGVGLAVLLRTRRLQAKKSSLQ